MHRPMNSSSRIHQLLLQIGRLLLAGGEICPRLLQIVMQLQEVSLQITIFVVAHRCLAGGFARLVGKDRQRILGVCVSSTFSIFQGSLKGKTVVASLRKAFFGLRTSGKCLLQPLRGFFLGSTCLGQLFLRVTQRVVALYCYRWVRSPRLPLNDCMHRRLQLGDKVGQQARSRRILLVQELKSNHKLFRAKINKGEEIPSKPCLTQRVRS